MNEVFDKKFFKVLLAAVLVVVCSAFIMRLFMNYASAQIIDNFEDYSAGANLSGNGTWYKYGAIAEPIITLSNQYSGLQSIEFFGTSTNKYTIGKIATTTAVKQCLYFDLTDWHPTANERFYYGLKITGDTTMAAELMITDGGGLSYWHGNTPWHTASTTLVLGWNLVCIEINNTQMRYTVNSYVSDWINNATGSFQADQILLGFEPDNSSETDYVYIDYLSGTEQEETEVIITEPPPWEGEIFVGAETANIPTYIDCLVGQTDCKTWVNYTFDQIGYDAYLIPESEGQDIYSAVASSTDLAMKLVMREYFTLPTQATATSVDYCVMLKDPNLVDDEYLCDTTVYWTTEEDLGLPIYDIESACDDVEASDTSTWDDMRYGIECAFRKVIYWAFTPHATSTQNLRLATEDFKKNFPMSLVNDYSARFDAISEYEGQSLTMPIGLWQDVTMSEPEPITTISLSTTSLMTYTDEDVYDQYYLYAQMFLYLLFAFYVFMRIMSILKREEYDN